MPTDEMDTKDSAIIALLMEIKGELKSLDEKLDDISFDLMAPSEKVSDNETVTSDFASTIEELST